MTAQPATIQVQYVNQPKEAHWKTGSIKDGAGVLYNIAKEFLPYFQQGQMVNILWEQTGKYPTIVGTDGQVFPHAPQPQPGAAPVPPTAAQVWKAPLAPKPPLTYEKTAEPPTPPILSNILATAIEAGKILRPEDLVAWAYHVRQAVDNYHSSGGADGSPGHQARSDIDSQYGGTHPDAPPMTDPADPAYQ